MKAFIVARKQKQEQAFSEKRRIVTTVLKVVPTYVAGIRTVQADGYWAVVFAYEESKKKTNKPQLGQLKKAGIKKPLRFLREVRIPDSAVVEEISEGGKKGLKMGDNVFIIGSLVNSAELFIEKDKLRITGVSKGKGFQGVVKRHGFKGGPRTHGQSDRERAPGSIGSGTTPGRINKGKRMAGKMGKETVTIKGMRVVGATDQEVRVKGLIPGSVNRYVFIENITS